jgi:hypothetical protein
VVSKGRGCSFTGRRAHAKVELSMGSYSTKVCIQPRTFYVRKFFKSPQRKIGQLFTRIVKPTQETDEIFGLVT